MEDSAGNEILIKEMKSKPSYEPVFNHAWAILGSIQQTSSNLRLTPRLYERSLRLASRTLSTPGNS